MLWHSIDERSIARKHRSQMGLGIDQGCCLSVCPKSTNVSRSAHADPKPRDHTKPGAAGGRLDFGLDQLRRPFQSIQQSL